MGQYYKPVNLDKKQFLYSHEYDNGLKLMEHSYIGNNFVAAVEHLIKKGGAWFGNRILWAGDYADPEPAIEGKESIDIYHSLEDEMKINPANDIRDESLRFLINLDTKEFVDLNKVPISDPWGNRIHPLPLLTCEGNGRGSGDFHGKDKRKLIGKWARNRVIIQKSKPKVGKELIFDLVE